MLVATVFFSIMNLLVKFLPHIPSYEIVFFRSLISLIITLSLLRTYRIPIFGVQKKYLILRGIFGVTALTMYFTTLQKIPLASAVTIQYLSPIFTTIFAIFILGEKVKRIQWLLFAIAFAGVAMIKGFDSRIETKYLILGILAAIFSGLAYNMVRKVKNTDHPWVVVLYFPLIGTPVTGIISAFNWVMPDLRDCLILLGIGICTQIAQVQMTKSLQSELISKVSSVRYIGVIYALALGFIFFGETYKPLSFLGIVLVAIGVILNIKVKPPASVS
ncbi:MAG: DMT family transporter [Chitinophagales bacterium]|nr:DMT family transporter [Chitinophagales bacterium]